MIVDFAISGRECSKQVRNPRAAASLRLILRSIAISAFTRVVDALWRCVSKDAAATWFETRFFEALLTMRPLEVAEKEQA